MEQGIQAAPDTGVTEQTADAPTPDEATPASNDGDTGVDRALSPAQARIQKLANENRQYRDELKKAREQSETLSGARELHEFLSRNPQKAKAVMDMLQGRDSSPASSQDPFEGYQPHEAEALRAAMEFKQWKAEQEQYRQQSYQQSIEENNSNLENMFEEKLREAGFVDKNGNYDEAEVQVIAGAVITTAMNMAKDPNRINEKEFAAAYNKVVKGMKSLEKRALRSTVKTSPPPPSASQRGSIPIGKTKENEQQRIARMVKELQGGRA